MAYLAPIRTAFALSKGKAKAFLFPNDVAILRCGGALLLEQNDD